MNTGRWLEPVDRFVAASFAIDPGGLNLRHLRRTLHWLLELDPGADEALQIAALAHDLQRAFRDGEPAVRDGFLDPVFLRHHQERGGELVAGFLLREGADAPLNGCGRWSAGTRRAARTNRTCSGMRTR